MIGWRAPSVALPHPQYTPGQRGLLESKLFEYLRVCHVAPLIGRRGAVLKVRVHIDPNRRRHHDDAEADSFATVVAGMHPLCGQQEFGAARDIDGPAFFGRYGEDAVPQSVDLLRARVGRALCQVTHLRCGVAARRDGDEEKKTEEKTVVHCD